MPVEFGIFGKYLWLLCAFIWLLGPRMPGPWIQIPGIKNDKYKQLIKTVGVYVAATSLVLWLIQLSSGLPGNPDPSSWQAPQRWLALIPVGALWAILIWWGLVRGGAKQIAEAFSIPTGLAKIFLLIALFVSVTSMVSAYQREGGVFGRFSKLTMATDFSSATQTLAFPGSRAPLETIAKSGQELHGLGGAFGPGFGPVA